MDKTYPTKAIILNRYNWREADRLVSVYTPNNGRLSLLARGASKLNSKLAAHIEPISLSQIMVIKGKGFDYLGSAIMTQSFAGIKGDLNKLYFAGRALEFFSRLIKEGEEDEALFNWLEKWLISLDQVETEGSLDKDNGNFRLLLFYFRTLAILGYALSLDRCLACRQLIVAGNLNRLDLIRGGLICPHCQSENANYNFSQFNQSVFTISDNCIKLWRYLDDPNNLSLKNLKFNKKLLKEWEILHEKRMAWIDV